MSRKKESPVVAGGRTVNKPKPVTKSSKGGNKAGDATDKKETGK